MFSFSHYSYSDNLKGAFGVEFGEKVSDEKHGFERVLKYSLSAGHRYLFDPEDPYGKFEEYSVMVTPESNRVFKIRAEADFQHRSDCESELVAVKHSLEKKYGKWEDDIGGVHFHDSYIGDGNALDVTRNERIIHASCFEYRDELRLDLIYEDEDLAELAEAEAARMEGGDYDGSGL